MSNATENATKATENATKATKAAPSPKAAPANRGLAFLRKLGGAYTRVSTEESTRASADTSLTTRVSTEESARTSGDLSLTTRVSTEESTRASADTSLTTRANDGELGLSLYDFREVDAGGDVGNAAANGGLLASDTTPILRGNAAETQEISWATANTDLIALQASIPRLRGTSDVLVDLWVNSGATDAATFTVESGWDGGALVLDTADDTATKSAVTHRITATLAAADVPDTADFVTLILTPAAHATDTIQLLAIKVRYTTEA